MEYSWESHNMSRSFFSAFLYYGQSKTSTKVMSALVISYLVLARTNNVLPDLQLGSIHHRIFSSK